VAAVNTGTGGWLAYPGQPYASSTYPLNVCVDYEASGSNTYYYATASTTNTNYGAATAIPTMTINQGSNAGRCPISSS
jgi:hypothetical protein